MSTDRLTRAPSAVQSYWTALERDWQSVAMGTVIVALTVAFGLQIPW